jgi:ribosomal protein S30
MSKLRVGILVTSGVLALGLSAPAWATSSTSAGGSNGCGSDTATRSDGGTTSSGADTPCVTTTSIGGVKTSIGAVTTSRPKAHSARKRHKLARRARYRKGHERRVNAVAAAASAVTR